MKKHVSTLAAVLVLAGAAATGSAQAAPLTGAIPVPSVGEMLVQKTQFYYQDREYCWYPNGWRGPGWYWCGYSWRRGYGWGGVYGWNGWARPGYGHRGYGGPRFYRGYGGPGHGGPGGHGGHGGPGGPGGPGGHRR